MKNELLDEFSYTVFTFIIKYGDNRSEKEKMVTNDLERGDYLKLDYANKKDSINVLTEDGVIVGYVDEEYVDLFKSYTDQLEFSVVRKVLGTKKRSIYVDVYFNSEIMDVGFDREFSTGYLEELGKKYENAFGLKNLSPEIAVEVFLDVAKKKHESLNKMTCYHQACMCYRQMGAYDNELTTVRHILNTFQNDMNEDSKEFFERRLDKVMKLMKKSKK